MAVALTMAGSLFAGQIVTTYTKVNKGLFGYNKVESTYNDLPGEGPTWHVDCSNPGLIRCKKGGGLNLNNDLATATIDQHYAINQYVDDQIDAGTTSGSYYSEETVTINGEATLVSFTTSWSTTNGVTDVEIIAATEE